MSFFYNLNQIRLGEKSQAGHVVYTKAFYEDGDNLLKVIYKKNKHGSGYFSQLEAAFSVLAQRFLQPDLTCQQHVVQDEMARITGLLSEHICYPIANRHLGSEFYALSKHKKSAESNCSKLINGFDLVPIEAEKAEEIPIFFFNELPAGFFAHLLKAWQEKKLSIDMDSLASVLCTAYTLEDDDFHKGNFGFYLINLDGKIQVVFFKIDHDLMFTDSIMSHGYARFANWFLGNQAFRCSPRDVKVFPLLLDSHNHYWPTRWRYFANPFDPKVYYDSGEIKAFVELGELPEFQQAKWRCFYKHILMPTAIIDHELAKVYNRDNPVECAQMALISNALATRQAQLRAVLFSIPEFRDFVGEMDESSRASLQKEILFGLNNNFKKTVSLMVKESMINYQDLCGSEDGFEKNDNPLHVAIRLGDYRYHETWQAFGHFAELANDAGEKPLDTAVKMAEHVAKDISDDPRRNPWLTLKHLLTSGAKETSAYKNCEEHFKKKVNNYHLQSSYINQAEDAADFNALMAIFRHIGEDPRYSLKMKKDLSLCCMNRLIASQKEKPELRDTLIQFKSALNGNSHSPPAPILQYIRQLRSELWIIRQIRGLLGGTTTTVALNKMVDVAIKRLSLEQQRKSFLFFESQVVESKEQEEVPGNEKSSDDGKILLNSRRLRC